MSEDDRVEIVARALVPAMSASSSGWGMDLPDTQFDDLTPDWQEAYRGYARAALAAIAMEARQGRGAEERPDPKDDSAGPKDIAQGGSHDSTT